MTRISKLISQTHPVKITVALALSTSMLGCMGKGYSIPGFSSKQSTKADAIETEAKVPLEQPVLGKNELAHVASHEVNLGESSNTGLAKIDFLGEGKRQQELVNISNSVNEKQSGSEVDAAFLIQEKINQKSANASTEEIRNYEGLITSVDGGASNLDALRRSLQELNETANLGEESTITDYDVNVAQEASAEPVLNETEDLAFESTAEESPPTSEEFPWANTAANTAAPVVNRVKGILNKATTLTQEGGRISSQAVTSTARTVMERTQSVFTPEQVTAEEILADMKARQETRQVQVQQNPVITPAQKNQADVTTYASSNEPAPVVIDLSREWINAPQKSKRNVDSIAQFAESTVVANQSAQLPVITPGHVTNLYQTIEAPVKRKPVPVKTQSTPTSIPNDVVQLGNVPVLEESHQMIVGTEEVESDPAFEAQSAPMMVTLTPQSNAAPFDDAAPFEQTSSAPILIAPGLGNPEANEDEEFDEFASAFADVTETGGPQIDESPLLIDESELSLKPKSNSRFSATHITMTCCGIAFLAMMLIRWRR